MNSSWNSATARMDWLTADFSLCSELPAFLACSFVQYLVANFKRNLWAMASLGRSGLKTSGFWDETILDAADSRER